MQRSFDAGRLAGEINSRLDALPSRSAEAMRAIRREYSRRLAEATPEFMVRLSLVLLRQPDDLCRFVAYELLSHHKPAWTSLSHMQLLKLGRGMNSWSAVDGFACYLAGPMWRDGRLPDAIVIDWTRSTDRWWRRAAAVSTVALSRRGNAEDIRRTVAISAVLVLDRDVMVVKALSWALRELAKKNPDGARRFLEEHRARLAARVIREVENKLATGLKNPRAGARKRA